MADMDWSLTLYLWLFLVSLCTSVCAIHIPQPEKQWVSRTQPATVRCGDDPSRGDGYYWWLGDDINNPSSFIRFGNGNRNCMDGSICIVDYSAFNRHPNTYICCTNNAAISIEAATFVYCREIAVCPEALMSVPLIVETDTTNTAYIKITTKPPSNLPPEDLLVISIEGGQNINITSSIMTPRLLGTDKALETVYVYQFQVPRELLVNSTTTPTLKFVPQIDGRIPSGPFCQTASLISVNGVSLQSPTDPLTTAPARSTTEGLQEETCVHLAIPIGISILTFFIGLAVGLVTCWTYWCNRNKRIMVDMSKHTENLGYPANSVKRGLPNPPTSSGPTLPFMQLHLSPNTLAHPPLSTQQSLTATPTPDESARLLAGQTPNNDPSMYKHPLNHDHIPPYATTDQMRSLSMANCYSPPEMEHITIGCRADGSSSPVGNPPPQHVTAIGHETTNETISSVPLPSEGYVISDGDGDVRSSPFHDTSPYTNCKEGNNMKMRFDECREETVAV